MRLRHAVPRPVGRFRVGKNDPRVIARLMDLAANGNAQPQVRSLATEALRSLLTFLKQPALTGDAAAHYRATADDIERFLARPDAPRKQTTPLATPPGDPIGGN